MKRLAVPGDRSRPLRGPRVGPGAALRWRGAMAAVGDAAIALADGVSPAGSCPFHRIAATIDAVRENRISRHHPITSIDQAMEIDGEARLLAKAALGNSSAPSRVPFS